MIKAIFAEPDGTRHEIDVPAGCSLMEVARAKNIPGILGDCGGACSCGTCCVLVSGAWRAFIEPRSDAETALLDMRDDDRADLRLSCQILADDSLDGIILELPAPLH